MYKPSQDLYRFGNRVRFNAYSMRSDDFEKDKTDTDELRVLVIGDSVVNGGSRTDQSQLATELLRNRLAEVFSRPVTVGNISTGSWGPGHQLAYIRRYGLFDADAVVLVLSSHDASDVPAFEPRVGVSSNFPDRKPMLAMGEAISRYLPRYLPFLREADNSSGGVPEADGAAIPALRQLLELLHGRDTPVVILQHPERDELVQGFQPGHDLILREATDMGVPVVQLKPAYLEADRQGRSIYRDTNHMNAAGQEVLAGVAGSALIQILEDRLNGEMERNGRATNGLQQ